VEAFQAIFNTALIVFIITTMLSAGLRTTFDQIAAVFTRWPLVLLVVLTAFVVRPLVGWASPSSSDWPPRPSLPW